MDNFSFRLDDRVAQYTMMAMGHSCQLGIGEDNSTRLYNGTPQRTLFSAANLAHSTEILVLEGMCAQIVFSERPEATAVSMDPSPGRYVHMKVQDTYLLLGQIPVL